MPKKVIHASTKANVNLRTEQNSKYINHCIVLVIKSQGYIANIRKEKNEVAKEVAKAGKFNDARVM
jgi:hypothetical protein